MLNFFTWVHGLEFRGLHLVQHTLYWVIPEPQQAFQCFTYLRKSSFSSLFHLSVGTGITRKHVWDSWVFPKGSCSRDFINSLALWRGGGIFKRWDLMGGLGSWESCPQGEGCGTSVSSSHFLARGEQLCCTMLSLIWCPLPQIQRQLSQPPLDWTPDVFLQQQKAY